MHVVAATLRALSCSAVPRAPRRSRPAPGSTTPAKPFVQAQRYVADPLLINGRKFGWVVWACAVRACTVGAMVFCVRAYVRARTRLLHRLRSLVAAPALLSIHSQPHTPLPPHPHAPAGCACGCWCVAATQCACTSIATASSFLPRTSEWQCCRWRTIGWRTQRGAHGGTLVPHCCTRTSACVARTLPARTAGDHRPPPLTLSSAAAS